MKLLTRIKEEVFDIFWPKRCVGCKKEGRYICDKCEVFLSEVENTVPGLISVWEYEGLMEKLIYKIKFDGQYHIIEELVEKAFQKNLDFSGDTYITYVPMYRKKEKQRGFNQAELIAQKVGEISGRPVIKLLEKLKDNRTQVGLNPKERIENVKNVFGLLKLGFNSEKLGFQNVLLVDDVYTTGATMKECKKTLKEAGVKNIWGFVIARKLSI